MEKYFTFREKTVIELHYDYRNNRFNGFETVLPDWQTATVGNNDVVEIAEHCAGGEGDKWFYDIVYNDGKVVRTFNPYKVIYKMPVPQI